MNINKVKISIDLFNAIVNMVNESVYKLIYKFNIPKEEIKILMPEWFAGFLQYQFNYMLAHSMDFKFICGIEILPHYKNEVVVYYKKYSVSNKRAYFKLSIDKYINIKNYESTRHTGIPTNGCNTTENNPDVPKP